MTAVLEIVDVDKDGEITCRELNAGVCVKEREERERARAHTKERERERCR